MADSLSLQEQSKDRHWPPAGIVAAITAPADQGLRASLVSSQTRLSSCASWLMMMTPPGKASSASASASIDCKRVRVGVSIGMSNSRRACGEAECV